MCIFYFCPVFQKSEEMARNGTICSILFVYFMAVMSTAGQYCPKHSHPIIEDQPNCTFQIHNDPTAVQNLLEMVANWNDKSIQDINIPIIISGNDRELTSHGRGRIRLHEWVMRNIDPDKPPDYISWRTDFKILSFGLLNEKVDSIPEFTLAIDETGGACTFQYGSESTTREIVRTVSNYIRESKLLDKQYEYENINMCFLSVFEWFKNSPWYFMKQYFGVPFQEFGNKCCKLYNQTVCCNDKLYNINGYGRLIPYIISVILICYVPLILLKVAKITNTLHPNYYHDFDNISDNGSQVEPSLMSMSDNIFCIDMCNECNNKCISSIINCIKSRVSRLLFLFLLPCGIYIEFIMFHLSKDWKAKLEDINTEHVLFGFTIILENGWNNTFIYPIGPSGFLIIYHVIGFIILVLPDNFEENIIKKGYFDCIDITILEDLSQQKYKNLPGYMKLERVLTTCMFMVFNSKFWPNCKCMVSDCKRWFFSTRVILFFCLPVLALPVFPFTIIISFGYAKFVMSKVYCKCFSCICNNENTDAQKFPLREMPKRNEQNQTTVKNTNDNGADNNTTRKCHCSCKTVMKVVYGCCSVLLMFLFVYLVAVIVSYTVYIIVYAFYFILWALVTSHTKTSGFLIFFSGGIIFVYNIIWKRRTSFYKELFNLTIDVYEKNEDFKKNKYYIKHQNGIKYINKDIVLTVQQAIYPFYICFGYTIMKLIAVGLFYFMTYFLVIRTGKHFVFENVTMLITSALPTLVASHFKHKLPNENIVKHIVHCYVEQAGSSNVNQVLRSPPLPEEEEEETGLTITVIKMD